MVELASDGGSGAEDLEDPGYLADQGKQPFDHDLSTNIVAF